jgi:hypothetical protein
MKVLTYANLAKLAYVTPPTFGLQNSASRAIKDVTIDGVVISIPGTNNIACDLADLDIELERTDMGLIHRGFHSAYLGIRQDLMNESPAIISAHSLGAAMALIYTADLCLAGKPPKAVFGFEPPRVSTDPILGTILAAHNVKLLLTWYGEDVVPMVPRILHKWQHPAPLTRIGKESSCVPNVNDHAIENIVDWYSLYPTEI